MHEVQMCERIKRVPHPNLVAFFGLVDEATGFITALYFKRYDSTLTEKVRTRQIVDKAACLRDIRAGIEHLHSLSIVHCDVNPHNVFWNPETASFVVGDFDSCAFEGDELGMKAGAFGWTNDEFVLAQRENDGYGLRKIEEFLDAEIGKEVAYVSLAKRRVWQLYP